MPSQCFKLHLCFLIPISLNNKKKMKKQKIQKEKEEKKLMIMNVNGVGHHYGTFSINNYFQIQS